jgi:hypothetical protein
LQDRRARRAHDRELGVGHELRDREQRADQRGDGKQLVDARGRVQRDVEERVVIV